MMGDTPFFTDWKYIITTLIYFASIIFTVLEFTSKKTLIKYFEISLTQNNWFGYLAPIVALYIVDTSITFSSFVESITRETFTGIF